MTAEWLLTKLGLGEAVVEDIFLVQVGMLAATAILFIASLILVIMAFRAAGAARLMRNGAEAEFARIEALSTRMVNLSDGFEARLQSRRERLELTDNAPEPAQAAPQPVRVGARGETPEAEIEIIAGAGAEGRDASYTDETEVLLTRRDAAPAPKRPIWLRRR